MVFQRILLALDAGESGHVATSFTVALARSWGAAVQVVHVNEYLAGGRGATCETQSHAVGVVAAAMTELDDAGVPVAGATYRTPAFDVPCAIGELAHHFRSDVIVLGSRRRRFGSLFRRSMRDRVARHCQLPILLAPAPLNVTGDRRRALSLPPQALAFDPDRA